VLSVAAFQLRSILLLSLEFAVRLVGTLGDCLSGAERVLTLKLPLRPPTVKVARVVVAKAEDEVTCTVTLSLAYTLPEAEV
jgi:hypothetical protein